MHIARQSAAELLHGMEGHGMDECWSDDCAMLASSQGSLWEADAVDEDEEVKAYAGNADCNIIPFPMLSAMRKAMRRLRTRLLRMH